MEEQQTSGSNKGVIIAVIALLVIASGIFAYTQTTKPTSQQNTNTPIPETTVINQEAAPIVTQTMVSPTTSTSEAMLAKENTIIVEAKNYAFIPKEIKVKKGTIITLRFKVSQGFHDFVIDELNIKTRQLPAGQEETISFTPAQTGIFEYYCSVGNHRQMGMVGKLIVE